MTGWKFATCVLFGMTAAQFSVASAGAQAFGSSKKASAKSRACSSETKPSTRAERTGFMETSHGDDVTAFLDSLKQIASPYTFGAAGNTTKGRVISYVIASRPRIATPEAARKSGRPVVYVNGNIHGGEVEGKEAMLAMLRDLVCDPRPNVLDSLVLIVVPNYNADGNDQFAAQSVNRDEQNGPRLVGIRTNASNLDLNRDYIKADAPETQAALALFNQWDPDVYVDLHTTDGSYHGFALTYSPSLAPGAPLGEYTRELLRTLRSRVRDRHGLETFDYGNFDGEKNITDSVKPGWYSYDARPRFGTNYYGLRGRISILSEAFSHDPFDRRVASTSAFVRELLSLVAERGIEIRQQIRTADDKPPAEVSIRAELTKEPSQTAVLVEMLERTNKGPGDSITEPGLPRGIRRTGRVVAQVMPVYDRFVTTHSVKRPEGYLIPITDSVAIQRLTAHGITTSPVKAGKKFGAAQTFTIDSVVHVVRPFQDHRPARVTGTWAAASAYTAPSDMVYVATSQRLGALAVYLLEPESDDGLLTWNFFDASLKAGQAYPVIRVGK